MVFSNKVDDEIRVLTDGWVGVTEIDDPIAFKAWLDWRHQTLGCQIHPKAFTVPTEMPPTTEAAAKQYVSAIRQIRRLMGWNTTSGRLPDRPTPWLG